MADEIDADEIATDPNRVFEDAPVIDVFGDSGVVRILTVINDAGKAELTVSDIADNANVTSQTVYNNLDSLIEYDFIEEAGKAGNATQYRAKLDSDTMQAFMLLRDEMIDATQ